MKEYELVNDYFEWMYRLVCGEGGRNLSFRKLLMRLYDLDYQYTLPMDENRWTDGVQLRYRYGREHNIPDYVIASELDTRPCSMLEMMLALSLRCEETIMIDDHFGNRTGQWFWNMISSLGLGGETDRNFRASHVDAVVDRFNNRRYSPNGEGGLFRVNDRNINLLNMDIWYQMQAYINNVTGS